MKSFIKPVWFRVELPPPVLMDFIARTPPEVYCLVPASGSIYFGIVLSKDVLEYLTNEFQVRSLEIVDGQQIKKVVSNPGCRVWGNADLIDY